MTPYFVNYLVGKDWCLTSKKLGSKVESFVTKEVANERVLQRER